MSLKHAILGFLNYRPASGYELKAYFDSSVRHFWPADQAQIYRTLSELAQEGLATVEKVPQEDLPNKKIYTITHTGREELHRWLITPLPPQDHRSAELIQVFFAGQLSDAEALVLFERFVEQHLALAVFNHIPQQIGDYVESVGSPRETFLAAHARTWHPFCPSNSGMAGKCHPAAQKPTSAEIGRHPLRSSILC